MRPDFVHLTILIDRSASMWSFKTQMEKSLNQLIQNLSSSPKYIELTLVYVDTEYSIECQNHDIKLESKQINILPRFRTALWDAMGYTMLSNGVYFDSMQEEMRPSKVVFIVLSDGLDNQSREFTKEQISQKVVEQRDVYSWEFIFLGNFNLFNNNPTANEKILLELEQRIK